jgi:TRAP-type C4-dicarboxylate transport system substrate-binding protein
MNEELTPIADAITLVANDQAGEATGLVHDLLGARVLDALQSHKQQIAQTLFAPSADTLTEELVQEDHESVEDFVKRGGKIKQVAAGKAKGSQPAQTIKKAKSYFHSRMNKG